MANYRGRIHDSGVDVLNGVSGMEHLSNSIVRKPLQNFTPASYQPTIANGRDYGFKRNEVGRP